MTLIRLHVLMNTPLLAAAALMSTLALGCAGPDPAGDEELVVSVKATTATRAPITATAIAQGSVFAKQEATISATVAGQLSDLQPIQNTSVRAGQVLAMLDAVDFFQAQKELRQAQATVSTTEALAVRRRSLFEQGGISKKDLEETELALSSAQDDLRAAQHTVGAMSGSASVDASGRASVRAPFAGIIAEQMQFGGEFVDAGTPLFKLVDVSGFVVKAKFPDTVGALLTEGSEATVYDEAFGDETATGTVTMVSRTSDPVSRTMEVWVRIDDPAAKVRAGDSARVEAPTRSDPDALVVPTEAVQLDESNGVEGKVMVVDAAGLAHETIVRVGIRSGDTIQILEGLKGGEQVVIEGNYGLPDLTKVTIEAAEAPEAPPGAGEPAPGAEAAPLISPGSSPRSRAPSS